METTSPHRATRTASANGSTLKGSPLLVAGLFAGIGGIERGLEVAGHRVVALCELEAGARRVLESQFPDARITENVCSIDRLPRVDLVAAGFPCQDLSQAGKTSGICGNQSSLVGEVFRLIDAAKQKPKWLLLENVPFMLNLDHGQAMFYLTKNIESLGYTWAYRTVDSRSFGLPQRRKRVILLASRTEDPREILFADDSGSEPKPRSLARTFGFYWTEGNNGLGWARDTVPPLKAGSGFGIPSPPAIWLRSKRRIVTPDLRDAERLQGFPKDWTASADSVEKARKGSRWRLVGNAVSVPVTEWLGKRIAKPETFRVDLSNRLDTALGWPSAAWGAKGQSYRVDSSQWPISVEIPCMLDFLQYPTAPLSARATAGFLRRARASRLRFEDGFLEDVAWHLHKMESGMLPPT